VRKRTHFGLIAAVVVAASGIAVAAGGVWADAYATSSIPCPTGRMTPQAIPLRTVIARADTLIPAYLRLRGAPHYIYAAMRLASQASAPPGADHLRRVLAQRCGSAVAVASWALFVRLPTRHLPSSARTLFIGRTKRGWEIYGAPRV
jgi:hypothetical protein